MVTTTTIKPKLGDKLKGDTFMLHLEKIFKGIIMEVLVNFRINMEFVAFIIKEFKEMLILKEDFFQ